MCCSPINITELSVSVTVDDIVFYFDLTKLLLFGFKLKEREVEVRSAVKVTCFIQDFKLKLIKRGN